MHRARRDPTRRRVRRREDTYHAAPRDAHEPVFGLEPVDRRAGEPTARLRDPIRVQDLDVPDHSWTARQSDAESGADPTHTLRSDWSAGGRAIRSASRHTAGTDDRKVMPCSSTVSPSVHEVLRPERRLYVEVASRTATGRAQLQMSPWPKCVGQDAERPLEGIEAEMVAQARPPCPQRAVRVHDPLRIARRP